MRRYLIEPRLATILFPSILYSSNIELIRGFLVPSHAVLFLVHFHALCFAFCLGKPSFILSSSLSHSLFLRKPIIIIQGNSGISFLLATLSAAQPLRSLQEGLLLPLPYFSISQSMLGSLLPLPHCAMIIFLQVCLATNRNLLKRITELYSFLYSLKLATRLNPCLPI